MHPDVVNTKGCLKHKSGLLCAHGSILLKLFLKKKFPWFFCLGWKSGCEKNAPGQGLLLKLVHDPQGTTLCHKEDGRKLKMDIKL